ncbi:MAG: AAA family ATPase [Saprospiraceae bacterium]|nr:AAA family ATPase [Saprospiraceae bacterium]
MNQEKKVILDTINLIEAQRSILGDSAVETILKDLRNSLANLEKSSSVMPANKDISMDGERKLVTIMFADFSNFTAMSERMDAEDVRDIMNGCFSKLVPIVEQYGGMIDKFIGDEIMALFGAPIAHENDAEYALRAALDMMIALEEFNNQHQTNLGLHFGINTGVVISGGVGSTERQQYSVMGDAVNLAARLEGASVTGEILVGLETYRLTSGLFDFEDYAPIFVKGKTNPVSLYRLIGLKSAPESTRGVKGLNSKMIGREVPFGVLQFAIDNLINNQGKVIALIGEPGVGKSRMLSELQQAKGDTNWIEGKWLSFAQNISYSIAKNMIDSILKLAPNTQIQEIGQVLLETLSRWVPGRVLELYPYLARLRGVTLDTNTDLLLRAITPEVMQVRMHQAFGELLLLFSGQQPTVVVWEDLHWADTSSLQLIEYLFQRISGKPILFILSFRPQEGFILKYQERWLASFPDYQIITLAPLSESDSKKLIENLLGIENLPKYTQESILQKAEGNPFYLEELLRSLLDSGILYWHEGQIYLKEEIEHLQIPNTLQGVIESRIDRLDSEEKIALQTAAVIGRAFGKHVLEYLLEQEKRAISINPTLDKLQDRSMIRQRILDEYLFKHAVTQDVTYNSLLFARRKKLHQYAAEALEMLFPTQIDELSSTLAWHYQRANSPEKAFSYLVIAADKSRLTFSLHDAEYYYREALKELEQMSGDTWKQKAHINECLGEVLVFLSRFDEARQAYQDAKNYIPNTESILIARILRKMGESYVPQRAPNQELEMFDFAIEALGASKPENTQEWWTEWLEIQLARIWSLYWLNRVPEMKQILETIYPICTRTGTIRQQSIYHGRQMLMVLRTEQYAISSYHVDYAEKALDLAYQAQDHRLISYHTGLLGMVYYCAKDFIEAEKHLLNSIELSQKLGDIQYEVVSLQFLNQTYIAEGNEEAVRKYANIMEEKATGKLPFYLFAVKGFYSWLAWKEGDLIEAEKQALGALNILNQVSIPSSWIKWILIDLYVEQQRYNEAIIHIRDLYLPYQFRIHPIVAEVLQDVLDKWDDNETESIQIKFIKVIEIAKEFHCL